MDYPTIASIVARKDPDELASLVMTLWGTLQFHGLPKKARTKVTKAASDPPKETWLTPSIQAWESVMGVGSAQYGWMAKYLAPLREHYGDDELGGRLRMYLLELKGKDELKFASIKRFSETIGLFSPDELAFDDQCAP